MNELQDALAKERDRLNHLAAQARNADKNLGWEDEILAQGTKVDRLIAELKMPLDET